MRRMSSLCQTDSQQVLRYEHFALFIKSLFSPIVKMTRDTKANFTLILCICTHLKSIHKGAKSSTHVINVSMQHRKEV